MPRVRRKAKGRRAVRRKAAAAPAPAPDPTLGLNLPAAEFFDGLRDLQGTARRLHIQRHWRRLFGEDSEVPAKPEHLLRARIGYELVYRAYRKAGLMDRLPEKVLRRRRALRKNLSTKALPAGDSLGDLWRSNAAARRTMMAARKGKKKTTSKRGQGIGAFMVTLLRRKTVGTNEEIVDEVKAKFPDSAFSSTHVSWYKNAFKQGNLAGQTKGEKINQPKVRAAKAASKAATGKKAGRKKATKKKAVRKKKGVRRKSA